MKKNSKLQDNSAHAATAAAAAVVGTATTSLPSVSSIGDGAGDETEAEASADLQVLASDNPSVESEVSMHYTHWGYSEKKLFT